MYWFSMYCNVIIKCLNLRVGVGVGLMCGKYQKIIVFYICKTKKCKKAEHLLRYHTAIWWQSPTLFISIL